MGENTCQPLETPLQTSHLGTLDEGYDEHCLVGLDINDILDDTKDIEIASMNLVAKLLKKQFGCPVGMLPPSVLYQQAMQDGTIQILKVRRDTNVVQIHYIQNHFVVSAQFNGTIYVYDSLDNKEHLESVVSQLRPQLGLLYENTDTIKLVVLQSQGTSNLCAGFAAANAYKLLDLLQNNSIPSQTNYNTSQMRRHLFKCLESKRMNPFPEETNEEIPCVNLTEPVLSSAVQPKSCEKPKILLATNPAAENGFDLENIKACVLTNGIWCRAPDHNTYTTLLHASAGFGYTEAVKYLIQERSVAPDIKDDNGVAPLHHAVQYNHYATAELLIKLGASVNIEDSWGNTPLHEAAWIRDLEMYKLLLEHEGDVNKKNKNGDTPQRLIMTSLQQWSSFYEAQGSSKTFNQVPLRMEKQEATRTDIAPRLLLETSENLGTAVRPVAASEKIEQEKGRKTENVRNTSKRHHSNKRKKSKVKKAVILSRREKALLQKILDKSRQGSLDSTQFSAKTKRERKLLKKKSIPVIHLKKCAGSNQWKIMDPLVNNGSHKPLKARITSVPERSQISEQDVLEIRSTAVTSDAVVQSFIGARKEPETAVASDITSLLPNFVDLGLEEERDKSLQAERDTNFETGVKKTVLEYLRKKGGSD